jgi:hypothetical protein
MPTTIDVGLEESTSKFIRRRAMEEIVCVLTFFLLMAAQVAAVIAAGSQGADGRQKESRLILRQKSVLLRS